MPPATTSSRQSRPYRAEREFGWIVGAVFLALGGWWLFRDKLETTRTVFLALGSTLVVLATIWPALLVWPNRAWLALGERLGQIATLIILGLVYFLVLTPIGLVLRLRGFDPLERRAAARASYWRPYSGRHRDPRHFNKMF